METVAEKNIKCYPIWSESNLAFLSLAIISYVANDGAFLSQMILAKFSNFMVPEMLENDRAWNLTGSDKSAFIPIESNSFGKWIAKDQSIISIKNWTSDVGYIFIHRSVVNLLIPVGPSAFHGSIVVHIPFQRWDFLSSSGFTKIHRVSCLDGRRCFHDPSFRRGYISYLF